MGSRIPSNRPAAAALTAIAALVLAALVLGACGHDTPRVSSAVTTAPTLPTTSAAVTTSRTVADAPPTTDVPERGDKLPPLPPMPKFIPPDVTTRSPNTSAPGARGGVDVFGDSLALQAWVYVQRIAADRGQPFDGGAYGGTALCDWLPAIKSSLRDDKPAYLVLAFSGNNITRCTLASGDHRRVGAPLVALYRSDAQRAIIAARAAGTEVFLVGPPAMKKRVQNADATGLRDAMRSLARRNPGVVYLDANQVLSPDGYRARRPCLSFETKQLGCADGSVITRAADGVHLGRPIGGEGGYSSGVWRYAIVLMRGIPNAS